MFDNRVCYASAGIGFMLDSGTQNQLWLMIDGMEVAAKDCLQGRIITGAQHKAQAETL